MSTAFSILITILIFNIIIVVHEFGHYITAKKFGVGIKEFSIGMGPAIYQRHKKESRFVMFRKSKEFSEDEFKFSIRLLPIGGFVSLKGEEASSQDPDSFSVLKPWKRLVVFLAGAFMNFVLGIVCISIIATCFIDVDITTKVASFDPIVTEEGVEEEALSSTSGLKVGDEIYKVNGYRTLDITDIQYQLALANKDSVDIIVKRNGELVTIEDVKFPSVEQQGIKSLMMDFNVAAEEKTFGGTLKYIGTSTVAVVKMVYRTIGDLVTGKIPITSASGIVGVTATVSDTVQSGMGVADMLYFFIYLTFLLTINIGLFNVLPIPALDGGQSCMCIFEMVTKKKIPEKVYKIITTIFFVALLAFMAFITVKDVIGLF